MNPFVSSSDQEKMFVSDFQNLPSAVAAAKDAVDLHVDLQAWFRAEGSADVQIVLDHFDPGFSMVTPAGATLAFEQVSGMFRTCRGTRPGLIMEISDVIVRYADRAVTLLTYRETQHLDGKTTHRLSTGLLVNRGDGMTPAWRHLQETWIA